MTTQPSYPGYSREQVLSAMIAAIYEDGDTAVVRQGLPRHDWELLNIAADAVAGLLEPWHVAHARAHREHRTTVRLGGFAECETCGAKSPGWSLVDGRIQP